ncbi:MAG: MFS transporter [Candidatus Gottesmanbacteria bacterium]
MRISPKFLIFFIVFISQAGYGILFPILNLYEKAFNVGPFLIAAAMGAYPIAQFFAGPILGVLSDRFGRRPLLIFSLVGTVIAFLGFAFAQNIIILFIARLIDGVSGGNISISQAYMADITSKEKRTEGMGVISGAMSLGFVVGPVIGGLFGQFGVQMPSLIAAALAFVNLLLVIFFLPETEKEEIKKQAFKLVIFKEIIRALKFPVVGLALILFFLLQTTWSLHFPIFSLFLNSRFAAGTLMVGILYAYRGVVSSIVQLFLIGIGIKLLGEIKLLKLAAVIMITGLLLTGFSSSYLVLIIGLTLMELGGDFIGPVCFGLVSKFAKPEEQGEMMGIAASVGSLGRVVGPYVGGAAFQELGVSMPFFLGAALMATGLILLF